MICDENGILVVDELYDKWNDQYVGGGRAHFTNLWMDHVAEFIKRDRCHPCVVLWSMGNELQSYNDTPFNDWGVTQYKLMKTLIQRYDTTRKVTVAMHPRYRNWETDSLPCDLAKVTDIQAYNYRYMYFPGDGIPRASAQCRRWSCSARGSARIPGSIWALPAIFRSVYGIR